MNGLLYRALCVLLVALPLRAQDNVLITEFMASNTGGLRDEDGQFSDWIEIFNAGTNTVNLGGWALTDNDGDLQKWQFPATNISVGAYIIVFASGKDRRIAGRELHANFQLSASGEYLALVKPDGTSIASSYGVYPLQIGNISFGLSQSVRPSLLITGASPARVLSPLDGALGTTWTDSTFDDSGWQSGTNGVGFDLGQAQAGEPFGTIAHDYSFNGDNANDSVGSLNGTPFNSVAFAPGQSGGRALSLNGTDQALDFASNDFGSAFSISMWVKPSRKGSIQTLAANAQGGATSNGFRLYINDANTTNGMIILETGSGAAGVATRSTNAVDFDQWNHIAVVVDRNLGRGWIYKNGSEITHATTRTVRTNFSTTGPWRIGQMLNTNNAFWYQGLIDHASIFQGALESSQVAALAQGISPGGLTVYGPLIRTDIEETMHNDASSAYIRIPFNVGNPAGITGLKLRMRYDDGFVAYINGVELARRNAPSFALGGQVADSVAEFSGVQGQGGWFYGYYNRTADSDAIYQMANFSMFPSEYWRGTLWDWNPAATAPWTELNANGGHPNGVNNGQENWAVRRWVSDVTGTLNVTLRIAKSNPGGGNGITGRVFHNGVQKYFRAVAGTDGTGITTNIVITDVVSGDAIDFAIDPAGADLQAQDGSDGTILTAVINQQASPPLEWNSTAIANRLNALGTRFEEMDLFGGIQWLQTGENVLAIHGLNIAPTNSDFFIEPELEVAVATSLDTEAQRYFQTETPGGPNGTGVADLGPIILEPSHRPSVPQDDEDIVVTARIRPTFAGLLTNQLIYRVMYKPEVTLPFLDDGLHGDGEAGDDIYGAIIPANVATNGEMVRWYIKATDENNRVGRWPLFYDPNNSAEYMGTIVYFEQTNDLPVMHWFVQNPAGAATDAGARSSIFFLGELYDNVWFNAHGQSSRDASFQRKPYDVDFNSEHHFKWDINEERVDDINLLQTYSDKAKMRNMLGYQTFKDAGSPYHYVKPVRVQQNATFYADYHIVENGDAGFLERNGRDPNGALYKMYTMFNATTSTNVATSNAEKKTRQQEGGADLQALYNGVNPANVNRNAYVYDNINIAEVINTMAARVMTSDRDCCHKNYYFYRDSDGTGEWEAMPWDIDLSFGRNWDSALSYWDHKMYASNSVIMGGGNFFFDAVYGVPAIRQAYFRRLRTIADEQLQAPGTPTEELKYEAQIDHWYGLLERDAALDPTRWPTWGNGASPSVCCTQTLAQAVSDIKDRYLPLRRAAVFNRWVGSSAEMPATPQPTNVVVRFGAIDYNPVSGNQNEEYFQVTNPNAFAVDMSGWMVTGAVEHVFQGGVVIPASGVIYVVPNKRAFRARAVAPRGGMQLWVEGEYEGQLNARGELLRLVDKTGREVASTNYTGNPSPQQLYLRVTEIMYRPATLDGMGYLADEYEYIELKNIGPANLSLLGVHFTNGIEFSFTGSAVTSLAPGQTVLIVKNLAAFTERYGAGFNIAGVFQGSLDNAGERIEIADAVGEKILDFEYNNAWYPITDGIGFSLVIVDDTAPWNTWDEKARWRPSAGERGSPGQNDPAPPALLRVLINELVNNSDATVSDSIELWNTNGQTVDIGGWYISDDFLTPRKFRIPNGTTIAAGGYRVFTEADFNTGVDGFAFGSDGDEAFLFSGNSSSNLTGYAHGFRFGAADPDVSFGRYVTSDANEEFVAQSQRTLGTANSYPLVGPIVISEVMYHPPDLAEGQDNEDGEYIELHNISGSLVNLFEPANPANTWRLRDAVDFDFPPNTSLAAGSFAIITSFNPTNTAKANAFRARYNVSPGIPLFGPYAGRLNGDSDSVELSKPGIPVGESVPYVLVDRVEYEDVPPWPVSADGAGASLQRFSSTGYGNDPTNWVAGLSLGAQAGGTGPSLSSQPSSLTVLAGTNVTFSAVAQGTGPLNYQWRFNGVDIVGANASSYHIPEVRAFHRGRYDVVVANGAGLAQSTPAMLSVVAPVRISGQPSNRGVRPGGTTNFTVTVLSSRPFQVQWRFNGTDIPNATNTTLVISNASTADQGEYQAYVWDDLSEELSQPATLFVLINPVLLQVPASQTVAVGSDVSFTTVVSNGVNLPLTFRWRTNVNFITNVIVNQYTSTLALQNIRTNQAYNITVAVTNMGGGTTPPLTPTAYLVVVVPPTNQAVSAGADVTFTAAVFDSANTPANRRGRVQWQFNGSNIDGATNQSLLVTNVQESNLGTYTLLVTNPVDMVTGFSAQLSFPALTARFANAQLAVDGTFQANLEGAVNRTYSVLFSSNLVDWIQLRTIQMTSPSMPFTDTSSTNAPQRFYRATLNQ